MSSPIRLDHIGIAVENPALLKSLFELLGAFCDHTESVPDQGVKTHFIPIPSPGAKLELLEVENPASPVAQFLAKKGPGIHHLSFCVKNGSLNQVCVTLKEKGFRLIYEQPRSGAHQMRINFIHPSSTGGLLIELMEPESERTS